MLKLGYIKKRRNLNMTKVIFSRKEFEREIKLTKEIEGKINLFGAPIESLTNDEIELEVNPNRPDLLSLYNYLRSLKTFIGKENGLKKYKINKPEKDYKITIDQSVKEVRPYSVCAIVKNLSLTEEKIKDIINLQEKITFTVGRNRKKMAIGIYPLDKISLPIIYTAKDPKDIKYHPLGAQQELTAHEILLAHPTGRKYAHILEGLKKYPVFIDANKQILSMPPIINSEQIGRIDVNTKEVFIECSGSDKPTLEKTLVIVTSALAEMGGKIYQMEIKDSEIDTTPNFEIEKMKISLENVNKLLGISLTESELSKCLQKMGHDYNRGKVEIAPWRTDILHEVDLIEDVAIAFGYNNILPEIPNISTSGDESKESIIKRKISEILIGLSLLEISSYHLIKQEEVESYDLKALLELENSKTEYKYLRPNLSIPLLRIIAENKDAEYPQKVFEIGTVFSRNSGNETGIDEKINLVIGLTPANATECKQHIDYLFKSLKLKYSIKEAVHENLIDGRTADIILNNKTIGHFGEVHPLTLKKVGIKMPIVVAEISLEEIFKVIN